MLRAVAMCVLAVIGVGVARSDSSPSGRDWSADRFLLGRWSCELTRPGHEHAREEAVYSLGLDDHWLKLIDTQSPDKPDTRPLTTEAYETFDERLKKWVYVSLGSDGDYGLSYSDGWKDGIKIYGPSPEDKAAWQLIATKVSDREFTEDVELAADGQWIRNSSLHCTKLE